MNRSSWRTYGVQSSMPTWREGRVEEVADRVGLAGGDDVVVGLLLLEHQPHRLDVVAGEAPVALGVEVAEHQLLLQCRGGCGPRPG